MLMFKQKKVHKMKISPEHMADPTEGIFKKENSYSVSDYDADAEVIIHSEKPALIIPIDQLRSIANKSKDYEFNNYFNKIIDMIASDQVSLRGIVEHHGDVGSKTIIKSKIL